MAVPSFKSLVSVQPVIDKPGSEIGLHGTEPTTLQTKDESTITVSSCEIESDLAQTSESENDSALDTKCSDVDPSATSEHVAKLVGSIPPPPKSIMERARAAALVLNRYRIEYKHDKEIPQSIKFSQTQIQTALEKNKAIQLVIPAFPFKSPNRTEKVLGALPDEAERVALLHLNGLCLAIKDAAECDAYLTIVSDGITYNDILEVPDQEVWRYGQHLRQLAEDSGCQYIRFSRICDLVGTEHASENLTEEMYLDKVPEFRRLLEANGPADFDVVDAIANDLDILKTYRGYRKFLETDLTRNGRSKSQQGRQIGEVAKAMITRGKAFAAIISSKYSDFVRLSIHPSQDTNKVSIATLPQDNQAVATPWHGALVRGLNGSISIAHAATVPAFTHDLIYDTDGRPSYFRERSDAFDWQNMNVTFEYLYPCGIVVKPAPGYQYPLSMLDMQKVRKLAIACSPVVLRGFSNTKNEQEFVAKAWHLGPVVPFRGHTIEVVRNEANKDPKSNNVSSAEAMPMHYDGIFVTKMVKDEATGIEKRIITAPHFQYFVSQSAAQLGDGYTLFTSSDLFVRHLPRNNPIEKLEKLKWTCGTHGFFASTLDDMDLVVKHPTKNTPCIRWHESWPQWKTNFGRTDVSIDNDRGSQKVVDLVNSLAYDRRVCLRFAWQEGDVLVNDNISMLHTRTSFSTEHPRELWRIHTN
ncbi:Clavaminate synthase-like protein [Xylaria castorea]|nr:Clavaminate synthase-like protein [Xylaria castorea]